MKDGRVDIVDICIKCNKLTDNDTGKPFHLEKLGEDPYYNYWVCEDCLKNKAV